MVHSKVRKRRVFACALLGALGETLILCVPLGNSSFKIIAGFGGITALLVYWLFQPGTKEYFYRLLVFSYVSASILGGILILWEHIFYSFSISFWGLCIGITVATEVVKIIYRKICVRSSFSEVELTLSGNSKCTVTALVDSGNGLVEPLSGTPVSIIEKEIIENFRQELRKENFRIVPFHSVGKDKGILEAYFIERLEIRKEGESIVIEKPMIAITKENISAKKEYQMILHPALLEN